MAYGMARFGILLLFSLTPLCPGLSTPALARWHEAHIERVPSCHRMPAGWPATEVGGWHGTTQRNRRAMPRATKERYE